MSQYEHFGPPEAPGPFGGFSGPPSQGPTDGSREPRREADRQSDAVARDPSKGDGASSIRRCRPGTRSFERRTRFVRIVQSAGEASHDEALLQDVAGKREPFRNPILQTHDRQEVDLRILKIESRSRTRPPSADLGREISKSLLAPQPQREREFLIRPLDT